MSVDARCSFCKSTRAERKVIVVAKNGAICNECAVGAQGILDEMAEKEAKKKAAKEPPPSPPQARLVFFEEAIARRAEKG